MDAYSMMTIDDLDIDDEYINISSEIENKCLVIYSHENNSLGTGFIIDNNGTFLSAGHVFKDASVGHYAYYKNVKYDYEEIFLEYMSIELYSKESKYCRDLFIGKLLDFHEKVDNSFHLADSSSLKIEDPLFVMGYSKSNSFSETSQTIDNTTLNLNKIRTVLCLHNDIIQKDKHRNMDLRLSMKNIKTIKLNNIERFHGLSGGPVFREKEIFGVFIADLFITSEYIMNVLKNLVMK